jgi:ribosomal protein L9
MVGAVTARQLCLYAARQLHVELPRQLLLMGDNDTITQFGSYTVPLNLKDEQGQQVELAVQVNKTYRCVVM